MTGGSSEDRLYERIVNLTYAARLKLLGRADSPSERG